MDGDRTAVLGQTPKHNSKREFCLVVLSGKDMGKTLSISKAKIKLGRDESADIPLDDPAASRNHAVILKKNDQIHLIDQSSTNGTYLNLTKVDTAVLKNGDRILIGTTVLKFLYADSVEVNFHDEIYKLAVLDGLTQVYNKKHFTELLKVEMSRAHRQKTPLSLSLVDIDNFKQINDTFGHQAGDYLLANIAKLFKKNIRSEDVLARYGGEEFIFMLPDTNIQMALTVMAKLRTLLGRAVYTYSDQQIKVTFSAGIQALEPSIVSISEFISLADKKLYLSKKQGKDRISI